MKIFVAGHRGLVGSAVVRQINRRSGDYWVGALRNELDLLDRGSVFSYLRKEKPDAVVMAAAKVGGILANFENPVGFLSENLQIQTNVMDAAAEVGVERLVFLGSSCIYPKLSPQPILESYLLSGPLEATNEAYAVAKIAGVKLVQAYRKQFNRNWISVMPTNVYGPGDNFHPRESHVIPGLMRKFDEALRSKSEHVTLWGTGAPLREFIYVEDLAEAIMKLLTSTNSPEIVNIGSEYELTIAELASMMSEVVGFNGEILWDKSKPDGTPRKALDSSIMNHLGWKPKTNLQEGLKLTYEWYLENQNARDAG